MSDIGESLKHTISNINDELSKSMKSFNNSFSATSGGQPIAAYGLAGFTIIVLGVMLMRSKEHDEDTSLIGSFMSKEANEENNEIPETDSNQSLFGQLTPEQENSSSSDMSNIFSTETQPSNEPKDENTNDLLSYEPTDYGLGPVSQEDSPKPIEQINQEQEVSSEQNNQQEERPKPPQEPLKQTDEVPVEPREPEKQLGGKKKTLKNRKKSRRKYSRKRR